MSSESSQTLQDRWNPFVLALPGERAPAPRPISKIEGIGDRLRAAAFAEVQARDAFIWAAERFLDAPLELRQAWKSLATEENKHLGWLMARMQELGIDPGARPVSDYLWRSFEKCTSAKEFALFMASAEDRGRQAGERFFQEISKTDPITGKIFGTIAEEEKSHIALAESFYGTEWRDRESRSALESLGSRTSKSTSTP